MTRRLRGRWTGTKKRKAATCCFFILVATTRRPASRQKRDTTHFFARQLFWLRDWTIRSGAAHFFVRQLEKPRKSYTCSSRLDMGLYIPLCRFGLRGRFYQLNPLFTCSVSFFEARFVVRLQTLSRVISDTDLWRRKKKSKKSGLSNGGRIAPRHLVTLVFYERCAFYSWTMSVLRSNMTHCSPTVNQPLIASN